MMLLFRKLLAWVLSISLIVGLIGLAVGIGLNLAFASPTHLKSWADNSGFYDSFVEKASSETAAQLGNSGLNSQLTPELKQSLISAFPERQFNQDINKIIDGNYAWLKGKTNEPEFMINIAAQKTAFANSLGDFVENQYQNLPACSLSDLTNLRSTNPLDLTCRVSSVSPSEVKAQTVSEIETSNIITSNTTITPNTIKLSNGKTYYSGYDAPNAYKRLKEAPIAFGVISIISILLLLFLQKSKRVFLTTLSICFGLSGLLLLAASSSNNRITPKINSAIAKHVNLSSFTTPVDNLVHKIVSYLSSINLWFGIGYLVIAITLLLLLAMNKKKHIRPTSREEGGIDLSLATQQRSKTHPTESAVKLSKNNRRLIQ